MTNLCENCTLRGNLDACKKEDCTVHESWYVKELEAKVERLRDVIDEIANTGTSMPPAFGDEAAWYRGLAFGMIRRAALAEKG